MQSFSRRKFSPRLSEKTGRALPEIPEARNSRIIGVNMKCPPTNTPEHVDIPALKEKYWQEREKRQNAGGESQYVHVAGDLQNFYATDPHKPVEPRAPISEEIDVAILGGGFGGILAAYHLTQAGVTNFRNIDHAGDFGGAWYWNR